MLLETVEQFYGWVIKMTYNIKFQKGEDDILHYTALGLSQHTFRGCDAKRNWKTLIRMGVIFIHCIYICYFILYIFIYIIKYVIYIILYIYNAHISSMYYLHLKQHKLM